MADPRDNPLGIVVVNYASHEMIASNLGFLTDIPRDQVRVVVVDNLSDVYEREQLRLLAQERNWDLVTPDSNLGFGGGMNLGVEHAIGIGCGHVLLLNPDVSLTASALDQVRRALLADSGAIISPKILRPDSSIWFAGGQIDLRRGRTWTRPRPGRQPEDGWLTGACLAISSQTWMDLGGFDDRYFMYWEDVDLTRRHLSSGGSLIVDDSILAVHAVGATQGTGRKSNLYARYVCRNRLLFASEHLRRSEKLRWILHTPAESWRIAMRDGRRSALTRPGYMFAAARGSISGVFLVIRSLFRGSPARGESASDPSAHRPSLG